MKSRYSFIKRQARTGMLYIALLMCGTGWLASCDYLDVVPVEQPGISDLMKDANDVRNMLYSCYGYIQNGNCDMPSPKTVDGMSDDLVQPQEWENLSNMCQWNIISPSNTHHWYSEYPWKVWYNAIGYCNQFLQQISQINFDFSSSTKKQYIAEVNFLKAYYHFRLLSLYGPIPIVDRQPSQNIAKADLPGRSHYDFCVKYIDSLLTVAAPDLPAVYSSNTEYGRATSVMCKALSAKMHVIAASPLWNGDFPDRTWKNKNYQTPGYGYELVSHAYDATKWEKARQACVQAISAAEAAGHKLFTVEEAEAQRLKDNVPLPDIPGNVDDDFKKKVVTMRYLMASRPDMGNTEVLWAIEPKETNIGQDLYVISSVPNYVITSTIGQRMGCWGGLSATLYSVEHFYTKDGLCPEDDPNFTPESNWFKSAGIASNSDIINLCVGREPRFYAWISFDGDQYSSVMANRSPLYVHMRQGQYQGYDVTIHGTRNYSPTGFLNKKWVSPNFYMTQSSAEGNHDDLYYPKSMMRLGELYLDLAECDAHLGGQYEAEAFTYLNKIRERAGVPDLTAQMLTMANKTLLQAVLGERFIELYAEHSRYYDIRRYVQGPKYLSKSCYMGLNAMRTNPSFEEFNTPTPIPQPFSWNNRQYLLPVTSSEIYSNPQMVQAPGY